MNTKLLLTFTAVLLAAIGILLSFSADNVMAVLGIPYTPGLMLTLQIMGAMYFAFAMLNWMAKGAIIGGIYNKPIAMANLTHFAIGGIVLIKAIAAHHQQPTIIYVLAGCYTIMAIAFWYVSSHHPGNDENSIKA